MNDPFSRNPIPFREVFDISLTLGTEAAPYPGDTLFARTVENHLSRGDAYTRSGICLSSHSGTHIDTPSHFSPRGATLDDLDVSKFILPAVVFSVQGTSEVAPGDFSADHIFPGDAVLFRTDDSEQGITSSGVFTEAYVSLSREAAAVCVERRAALVGIDSLSVDGYHDESCPTHLELLGNNVLILENVNLRDIVPGRYVLICLPLKIPEGEASPVRAVLAR